jgi:transcriptional regulator with XRE-family HTH domain
MISEAVKKLRDSEYRKALVASQINIGIPFQIRALMKSRQWNQGKLAEKTGMLQPRISGLMTPGKTRPNIHTLRRLAEAFDCGLMVRFVPFSELLKWSENFDPESFTVPEFGDDPGLIERKEPATATATWLVDSFKPPISSPTAESSPVPKTALVLEFKPMPAADNYVNVLPESVEKAS